MKTTSWNPDSVSKENITPELAKSDLTIFCTPMDNATLKWSNPLSSLYEIALFVNKEAKHFLHAINN